MTDISALDYIHSISWRGSRLGLTRIRELLSKLGDPQKKLRFVHVAGTNGKGSVCAMMESSLRAAGFKTGLFTSPYINRFHERIRVSGAQISDRALEEATDFIRPFAESMDDPPTEFELITAVALVHFLREACDIVVLETGMGGELDSTNVIDQPEVAVITSIGMDHVRELGPTLSDIAKTKAGIIKGGLVAAYPSVSETDTVLIQTANQKQAELAFADFSKLAVDAADISGTRFSYDGMPSIRLPLAGTYQPKNAALAITALRLLREKGWAISDEAIRRGLETVSWPGRFEVLAQSPLFLLDGAHNPQGMASFADSIKQLLPGKKLTVVIGAMADKEIEPMLEALLPFAHTCFTVKPENPRAMDAVTLAENITELGLNATPCQSISEGVRRAVESAGKDGVVCALGTLYFSADIRRAISRWSHENENE